MSYRSPDYALNAWIIPACDALAALFDDSRLTGPAPWALLLRTIAVESAFQHRRQLAGGPARSYFQIEPETAGDCGMWLRDRSKTFVALADDLGIVPRALRNTTESVALAYQRVANRLEADQFAAAMTARLIYWRRPEKLPVQGDVRGQARYWKQWWNTNLGRGTTADFMGAHRRHLMDLELERGWISPEVV